MPGFHMGARDNLGPHAAASTLSAEPSLQPFSSQMQIWLHNTIVSRAKPHGHLVSAQASPISISISSKGCTAVTAVQPTLQPRQRLSSPQLAGRPLI